MGDRVSISFRNDGETSVTLFSHWRGMELVEYARAYVARLKKERKEGRIKMGMPLGRLQPNTVMVDFIRDITVSVTAAGERVEGDLYLGKDGNDGDNSDNGHHVIEMGHE